MKSLSSVRWMWPGGQLRRRFAGVGARMTGSFVDVRAQDEGHAEKEGNEKMVARALVMGTNDNVATLVTQGHEGDECELRGAMVGTVRLLAAIPYGHKIAIMTLQAGDEVRKYGEVIGRMTREAAPGEHVHVHNVGSVRRRRAVEVPQAIDGD